MGVRTLRPAVFFDRDGVLNAATVRAGKPHPPRSVAELRIDPHAKESVERVAQAGFVPVIITNQPDVARGSQLREVVERINGAVCAQTGIGAVYTCYHDDAHNCDCRKPKPGLLLQAADELELDLPRSYFIGDRASDVTAARAAGCTPVFLDLEYPETPPGFDAGIRVTSLAQAVEAIFERESRVEA